MKIKKYKNNRKLKLVTALVVLSGVFSCYYVYGLGGNLFGWTSSDKTQDSTQDTSTKSSSPNLEKPTSDQVKAGNDAKSNSVKNGSADSGDTNSTSATTVTVNAVLNDSNLRVQTTIGKVTNEGSCSLTLTKASFTKSFPRVGVQALPGYSTCKFTDIDISYLDSGTWQVKVVFTSSSATGSAITEVGL